MTDCGGLKAVKVELFPGAQVVITVEFDSSYEAAIAYQDLSEAIASGEIAIAFCTPEIKSTVPRVK